MTKQDIIQAIVKDKAYNEYCFKVCQGKDIHNDLYQYVIEYCLNMESNKIEDLYISGGLRNYLTRVIYINAKSKTAPFWREHECLESVEIEVAECVDDEIDYNNSIEFINLEIKKESERLTSSGIYPANVKLFELYVEHGSIKKVSELTKVPYMSVYRHVNGLIDQIKKNIK